MTYNELPPHLKLRLLDLIEHLKEKARLHRRTADMLEGEVERTKALLGLPSGQPISAFSFRDVVEFLNQSPVPVSGLTVCRHFNVDGRHWRTLRMWAKQGLLVESEGQMFSVAKDSAAVAV